MSVELKTGLWGVSRDKQVWGPFVYAAECGRYPFSTTWGTTSWNINGRVWVSLGETQRDIIATFKTEAGARAYAENKPWYHRRWPALPFILAALAVAAWFILLGCGVPTSPAQNNCETQAWNDSLSRWEWIPCNNAEKE